MQSFFQFSRGALIASALALTAGAAQAASMAEGVKSYKPFVVKHIGQAIAGAKDMQAAVKVGVPAPRVRAVLDLSDGLAAGYITVRFAVETLAARILRDDRYAPARKLR